LSEEDGKSSSKEVPMKKAFKGIYSGKRVLVTGHTGFKGSWLSIWLKELGARVLGYSLEPPTTPSNFTASRLEHHIEHTEGDVRGFENLLRVFKEYKPEIVMHLAAQSIVRKSYMEPAITFSTNTGGTINVMEAVRATDSVRAFINVTSDKCYENQNLPRGYREEDPMGGHDPYSASKGCAELAFGAYLRSFFSQRATPEKPLGAGSVRAGNVLGGGDWAPDRLIPDCVRALVEKCPVAIRSASATRPWIYVLEPLSGYLWLGAMLLAEPEKYSGAWNFGPSNSITYTVKEVVQAFIKYWGHGSLLEETVNAGENPVHEAHTLILCSDKSRSMLCWRAFMSLDETIRETVHWYRIYYNNCETTSMYATCVEQIERYTSDARKNGIEWAVPSS